MLIVSDLHYSLRQFDWLITQAAKYDAVVIAGDLLDIVSVVEPDVQIVVVSKYLERLRKLTTVIVCSGNHDGDTKNSAGEFVARWLQEVRGERAYVDGDSFRLDDDLVTVCPWWDGEVTRSELAVMLEDAADKKRRRWIWIHHAPPDDEPVSWAGRRYGGDKYLCDLIERYKPDVVISGHIHNAPFLGPTGSWTASLEKTRVFNPGKQIGPVPSCITLDLEAGHARFFSIDSEEEAALSPSVVPVSNS